MSRQPLARTRLFSCTFVLLSAIVLFSCSKTVNQVVKIPYVDTAGILISNHWKITHFWYDMNNNGRIDNGEHVNGYDFENVYLFGGDGKVQDSTVAYLTRSGTWSFKDNYKSAFYCRWNTNKTDLHYIVSISDTNLITKLWGTNETWYFSAKHL